MDNRNGNWNIYVTFFRYGSAGLTGSGSGSSNIELTYPSPSLVTWQLENLKSTIADNSQMPANVFDGANLKVKENRRNAILNKIDSTIASLQAAANTQNMQVRRMQCQNSIEELNELLSKTDGFALRETPDSKGSGYTPDWITSSTTKDYIYPQITACIITLQFLLENIDNY